MRSVASTDCRSRISPQNENAPDSKSSLGTFVEQTSPEICSIHKITFNRQTVNGSNGLLGRPFGHQGVPMGT